MKVFGPSAPTLDSRPRLHNPDGLAGRLKGEVVEIPGDRYRVFACTLAQYLAAPPSADGVTWLAIGSHCVGLMAIGERASFTTAG